MENHLQIGRPRGTLTQEASIHKAEMTAIKEGYLQKRRQRIGRQNVVSRSSMYSIKYNKKLSDVRYLSYDFLTEFQYQDKKNTLCKVPAHTKN